MPLCRTDGKTLVEVGCNQSRCTRLSNKGYQQDDKAIQKVIILNKVAFQNLAVHGTIRQLLGKLMIYYLIPLMPFNG
jgi:hypothetical protein